MGRLIWVVLCVAYLFVFLEGMAMTDLQPRSSEAGSDRRKMELIGVSVVVEGFLLYMAFRPERKKQRSAKDLPESASSR